MRAAITGFRGLAGADGQAGFGCALCQRSNVAQGPGPQLCGACRKSLCPTMLDQVLDAAGLTAHELAGATGIPVRTLLRAARGDVSKAMARRLERATGVAAERFR